ncbi:MAG: hypothetical protein IT458_10635 [Planctomycetes bacterium]|nr:hypothetical protein [Planctomycetota bacterium]
MELPLLNHPERLLWLLVLPLLWLLARPLRPRQRVATPHLVQWQRALARLKRRPQRFPWLRFLALALAFACGALALADATLGARPGPRQLAVVVDASASLAATSRRAPRGAMAAAVAALAQRLAELPRGVDVRVLLAGTAPQVLAGNPDTLVARLSAQAPAGRGLDLAALAASLARPQVAVWTVTDGLGPSAAPEHGALTLVGEPADNLAITACAVEDAWPLPEIHVRLTLRSFAGRALPWRLAITGGVAEAEPHSGTLAAGAVEEVEVPLRRAGGGGVRIALDGASDALALDDGVRITVAPPPSPKIAVLAEGTDRRWIDLAARVLAEELGGSVMPAADASAADFLLAEGGVLGAPPAGLRAITFGTRVGAGELAADDLEVQPLVADWDRDDPITKDLDLSDLRVRLALRSGFGAEGKTLVAGESRPLVVLSGSGDRTCVHAAFRLADTNFPLLAAFPSFLRRAYARSHGAAPEPVVESPLLDPLESDLRAKAARPEDRPLPAFGDPGKALAVPLLLAALAFLALRIYL